MSNTENQDRRQQSLAALDKATACIEGNFLTEANELLNSFVILYKKPENCSRCDTNVINKLLALDLALWKNPNFKAEIENRDNMPACIFAYLQLITSEIRKYNDTYRIDSILELTNLFPDSYELRYLLAIVLIASGENHGKYTSDSEEKLKAGLSILVEIKSIFTTICNESKEFANVLYRCCHSYINFLLESDRLSEAIKLLENNEIASFIDKRCYDCRMYTSLRSLQSYQNQQEIQEKKFKLLEKKFFKRVEEQEKNSSKKMTSLIGTGLFLQLLAIAKVNVSALEFALILLFVPLCVAFLWCFFEKALIQLTLVTVAIIGIVGFFICKDTVVWPHHSPTPSLPEEHSYSTKVELPETDLAESLPPHPPSRSRDQYIESLDPFEKGKQ